MGLRTHCYSQIRLELFIRKWLRKVNERIAYWISEVLLRLRLPVPRPVTLRPRRDSSSSSGCKDTETRRPPVVTTTWPYDEAVALDWLPLRLGERLRESDSGEATMPLSCTDAFGARLAIDCLGEITVPLGDRLEADCFGEIDDTRSEFQGFASVDGWKEGCFAIGSAGTGGSSRA